MSASTGGNRSDVGTARGQRGVAKRLSSELGLTDMDFYYYRQIVGQLQVRSFCCNACNSSVLWYNDCIMKWCIILLKTCSSSLVYWLNDVIWFFGAVRLLRLVLPVIVCFRSCRSAVDSHALLLVADPPLRWRHEVGHCVYRNQNVDVILYWKGVCFVVGCIVPSCALIWISWWFRVAQLRAAGCASRAFFDEL